MRTLPRPPGLPGGAARHAVRPQHVLLPADPALGITVACPDGVVEGRAGRTNSL